MCIEHGQTFSRPRRVWHSASQIPVLFSYLASLGCIFQNSYIRPQIERWKVNAFGAEISLLRVSRLPILHTFQNTDLGKRSAIMSIKLVLNLIVLAAHVLVAFATPVDTVRRRVSTLLAFD